MVEGGCNATAAGAAAHSCTGGALRRDSKRSKGTSSALGLPGSRALCSFGSAWRAPQRQCFDDSGVHETFCLRQI